MTLTMINQTVSTIREAIRIREQIDRLTADLNALLSGGSPAAAKPQPVLKSRSNSRPNNRRKRRKLSAEARARMAAAQKARRAKERGDKPAVTAPASSNKKARVKPVKGPKKRRLTKEGRAKLSALMKARWVARRNAAKS